VVWAGGTERGQADTRVNLRTGDCLHSFVCRQFLQGALAWCSGGPVVDVLGWHMPNRRSQYIQNPLGFAVGKLQRDPVDVRQYESLELVHLDVRDEARARQICSHGCFDSIRSRSTALIADARHAWIVVWQCVEVDHRGNPLMISRS